jgi:hypothetical protein
MWAWRGWDGVRFLLQDCDHPVDDDVQAVLDAISAFAELQPDVEDFVDADFRLFIQEENGIVKFDGASAVLSAHSLFSVCGQETATTPRELRRIRVPPHAITFWKTTRMNSLRRFQKSTLSSSPPNIHCRLREKTGGTTSREPPCPPVMPAKTPKPLDPSRTNPNPLSCVLIDVDSTSDRITSWERGPAECPRIRFQLVKPRFGFAQFPKNRPPFSGAAHP